MIMKSPADQAVLRAKSYWQIDGLTEIGFSLILIFLGLYFYFEVAVDHASRLYRTLEPLFFLLLFAWALLVSRGISWAKQRITYPRTGYVEYARKKGPYRLIAGVSSALVSVLIVTFVVSGPKSLDWLPLLAGFIFAIVLVVASLRGTSPRFYLLAFISLFAGLGLSLLGIGNYLGAAYFYWIMAIVLLVSGGFTLKFYLRSTQLPVNTE
jgi:hypothetical protein